MTTTTTADAEVETAPLESFYLTFGVQYSRERHPYWEGANPDGWVLIKAQTYDAARRLAVRHFGLRWSMLYDKLSFDPEENQRRYYPLGSLALITPHLALSYRRGVETPTPHITESDPEYHGVAPSDVVAVRVEGHLLKDPGDLYDVELFHRDCAEEGLALFRQVNEEDNRVRAFELDWRQPAHCTVCETSIT